MAGRGLINALGTRAQVVDKPVETVDSRETLLVLPEMAGADESRFSPGRVRGPDRRRG